MSNLVGSLFSNVLKQDASGNVTVEGDLTVTGTTTTVSTTNSVLTDKIIELGNGVTGSASGDAGIVIERGSDTNVFIGWDESEDKVTVGTGSFTGATTGDLSLTDAALKTGAITASGAVTATSFVIGSADINENDLESIDGITAGTVAASKAAIVDSNKDITGFRNVTLSGELDAASLDISGDADIDGTLEADAITVGGAALNTVIAGVTVTNATNAVNATHVTVTDNENANEENLIPFIEDASATGNVGLESDGDFAYNPSTGTVTATVFKGNIDAVDGDFDGTLEADAITVDGTPLDEFIQDTVGAMVSSNTETGIAVTYEDGDGTLDFVLAAVGTNAIADDAVTVAKIEDLARGQIIYGNASGETAKLSPGSANQVLTSDGQDISWQNASGGGATLDLNLILHTQVFGR
tara:strand:- start:22 stop:1257 length:1236 start_codon:yes stop_codon:yes gene_type:complete